VSDSVKSNKFRGWIALGLIALTGIVSDRLWFALDQSVPAWDQADYLMGGLLYHRALQNPQWLDGEWWRDFWLLSSKIPPLTYMVTAGFIEWFGASPDQETLVNVLFSVILLGSVYGLGVTLFNRPVGLWAAGLCVLLPGLYLVRLDFLLDYPLAAVVTLCFWVLTVWRGLDQAKISIRAWLWASFLGICLGGALLLKQTALFFLLVPMVWVGIASIFSRQWGRVVQLLMALGLAGVIIYPWYRTNWLLILTSGKRATVDSAIAEGDPALNTLDAWTFYWQDLPNMVSWPLLLVPIVGIILYGIRGIFTTEIEPRKVKISDAIPNLSSLKWLAIFWLGSYLLCSLNINKDSRYVVPYLPVFGLFLAYGLTLYPRRWGKWVRWGTAALGVFLMLLNIWPAGGGSQFFTQLLSPRAQHYAYLGMPWPHEEVIQEVIQTEPYLDSTIAVLPSTPEINQHNINYFGSLANFQVNGRQVGVQLKQVPQDVRSLSWFLIKTGDQGSVPMPAQPVMVQTVETSKEFQLQKSWSLPDGSQLKLYHRQAPFVEVKPVKSTSRFVQLNRVKVPESVPPGMPVPVSYEWSGTWKDLHSGIILLTWKHQSLLSSNLTAENLTDKTQKIPVSLTINASNLNSQWLHDHAIGMGQLYDQAMSASQQNQIFQVIENTAMLPPLNTAGVYQLEATYLNRYTGESYPIQVPTIQIKIDPAAKALPAPELDFVTQLRILAVALPQGPKALESVFEEIGRINQYNPGQDYTTQAELAMAYRLKTEGPKRSYAYTLALARVLQQDPKDAIKALETVVQLDPKNPYAYGYLAFVHLYTWNGNAAQKALEPALALNPNLTELKLLRGVAALMQGNLVQFWQDIQRVKELSAS
jgi:4-amino-4-deoxy-L-arabinose transferase-like glycosyltransferase